MEVKIMSCVLALVIALLAVASPVPVHAATEVVRLPEPRRNGPMSVERALVTRRSCRAFAAEPVELVELSQLLWAAQGITRTGGRRTTPSAGALYPLEVIAVVGRVGDLDAGVYRYRAHDHTMALLVPGDKRAAVAQAALNQEWVRRGAVVLVLAAVYERTTRKYGERGVRYARMEAGNAVQNVYLQAASLGLGTVVVGAFDDSEVRQILGLSDEEHPLAIMPVGREPGS